MRILVLGSFGYIGTALVQHLLASGHTVTGIDNLSKRKLVAKAHQFSLTPKFSYSDIVKSFNRNYGVDYKVYIGDVRDPSFLQEVFSKSSPEVIIDLAKFSSSPFSMESFLHARETLSNNIESTLSLIFALRAEKIFPHIILVNGLTEYFQSLIPIPESHLNFQLDGLFDSLPFPKSAKSVLECSKISSTFLWEVFQRTSGFVVTNLKLGIGFGATTDEIKLDSEELLFPPLYGDSKFGSVINRFCIEGVKGRNPLTIYGTGNSQVAIISLRDIVNGLGLLILNPPKNSQIVHHFTDIVHINDIAYKIKQIFAEEFDLELKVRFYTHLRPEVKLESSLKIQKNILQSLGFHSKIKLTDELQELIKFIFGLQDRVKKLSTAIHLTWD